MATTLHADVALARRYDRAISRILVGHVSALAQLRPAAGAGTMAVGGGYALYLGAGTPPGPNRVIGLGMTESVTADHLDAAEQFYREQGLPTVIGLNPMADASLFQQTAARGYAVVTFRNVLACRVPSFPGPVDGSSVDVSRTASGEPGEAADVESSVEVSPATSAEAELWATVVSSGFAEQELDGPAPSHLAAFNTPDTVCYFGRVDGVEAGGGAMTIVDGLAYIWDVSTRLAFRRRGVQLAVYRALLDEAARAGCDVAALATEVAHGSQRNAERVGFHVIYTAAAVVKPVPGGAAVV